MDDIVAMRVKIETIRRRTYRWEFSAPGTGYFWASIQDEGFRDRIDQRAESFDKGDYFECEVRVQQWEEGDGSYRTERTITSVLQHLPGDAAQQVPLMAEEE